MEEIYFTTSTIFIPISITGFYQQFWTEVSDNDCGDSETVIDPSNSAKDVSPVAELNKINRGVTNTNTKRPKNERDGNENDMFWHILRIFYYLVNFKALICCIPCVLRQIAFKSLLLLVLLLLLHHYDPRLKNDEKYSIARLWLCKDNQ